MYHPTVLQDSSFHFFHLELQLPDLQTAILTMKAALKFTTGVNGEESVLPIGPLMMPMLHVENLDSLSEQGTRKYLREAMDLFYWTT